MVLSISWTAVSIFSRYPTYCDIYFYPSLNSPNGHPEKYLVMEGDLPSHHVEVVYVVRHWTTRTHVNFNRCLLRLIYQLKMDEP